MQREQRLLELWLPVWGFLILKCLLYLQVLLTVLRTHGQPFIPQHTSVFSTSLPFPMTALPFPLSSWLKINPQTLCNMHLQGNLALCHAVGYFFLSLDSQFAVCTLLSHSCCLVQYISPLPECESVSWGRCLNVGFVFITPLPAQEALHTGSD